MKVFFDGERIVVTNPEPDHEELKGATGRVARRRHGDAAAWVKMDAALPEKLRRFSDDDPRATHVLLFPDECERAT